MSTRLFRTSTPETIEHDLAALWRDAGRDGPVARAVMANLVVYCERAAQDDSQTDLAAPIDGAPVDQVAERHPSRVIVLHHDGRTDACAPAAAAIEILIVGPPQARFGVEKIAVRSACAEASLPSIVRCLAFGDLPTSIWWTEDLSRATPLDALLTMGRQLVYDSRRWQDVAAGMRALAPLVGRPHAPDLADLNWRRLMPMRQALSQALAPPFGPAEVQTIRLRIRHRDGEGALAWLLAGWFASRLGWPATMDLSAIIDDMGPGDDVLAVLLTVNDHADVTATMNAHRVLVEHRGQVAPMSVSRPHETDADAIAAELRTLSYDVTLRDTVVALAERFTSSRS